MKFKQIAGLTSLGALGIFIACSKPAPANGDPFASIVQYPSRPLCTYAPSGGTRCLAYIRTDDDGNDQTYSTPTGITPANIQAAYGITAGLGDGSDGAAGSAGTVAIIDAYDDPTAEEDLAVYRKQFGLPACTTANGCFAKVNQNGQTSPLPESTNAPCNALNKGWAGEITLDLDAVSAACPACKILLIEANSSVDSDIGSGMQTAASMGATAVSLSLGRLEQASDPIDDSSPFNVGIPVFAASGDDGYGDGYPVNYAPKDSEPTMSLDAELQLLKGCGDGAASHDAGDGGDAGEGGDAGDSRDDGGSDGASDSGGSGGSDSGGGGAGDSGGSGSDEAGGSDGGEDADDCVSEEDEDDQGDGGEDGGSKSKVGRPETPANLPFVTAVGGTSLVVDSSSARGWDEQVWSGAGSGCSQFVPKPSWQTDKACSKRTVADVSALADPNTGLAIYLNGAWSVLGGTSLATPLVTAMFVGSGNSAMLQAGYAYDNGSYFNDVTSGANAVELGYGTCRVPYLCNGEPGYDAPSGVGTPNMGGSGNGSATVSGQSEGGTDGSNEGGKRKCGSKDGGSDAGDASDGGEDGSDDGSGGGGEGGVTCDNAEHSAPSP